MPFPRRHLVTLLDVGAVLSGSAGGGMSPDSIPGLGGWWKADAITTKVAANFRADLNQYLLNNTNSQFQFASGASYTICGWYWSDANSIQHILIKRDAATSQIDYQLHLDPGNGLVALVGPYPSGILTMIRPMPGLGQWIFLCLTRDGTTGQTDFRVNNGAPATAVGPTTSVPIGSSPVSFGAAANQVTPTYNMWGRLQNWAFFERVLSPAEQTYLYNSANGRRYAELSTAFKTGLRMWFPLTEMSGNRVDAHSGVVLTSVNNVSFEVGMIGNPAQNGDAVSEWQDSGPNGLHVSNALASAPSFLSPGINGLPVVSFPDSKALSRAGVLGSLLVGANSAQTVFMVMAQSSLDVITAVYSWDSTGETGGNGFGAHLAYSDNLFYVDVAGYTQGVSARYIKPETVGWRDSQHIWHFTRLNPSNEGWVDGTSLGAAAVTGILNNTATAPFKLGTIGTNWFYGWIGELIIYNRDLTATERDGVYSYLAAKWGIASSKILNETAAGGYLVVENPIGGRLSLEA